MQMKVIGPGTAVEGHEGDSIRPIMGMDAEEFGALTRSVLIVILHTRSEGVNGQLAQTIGIWAINGTLVAVLPDPFGGFIEVTRAAIVKAALDIFRDHPHVDKLVMIDGDESVAWDAPYRLAQWDRPVVSGVVCTSNPHRGVFACFTVKDKYGAPRFPSLNYTRKLPARGLIEAHSVGTGLICIKKEVLLAIQAADIVPFMIPEDVKSSSVESGTLKWGEDIAFSRQCEALGFQRYVDLSVHAEHFKTIPVVWPRFAIDQGLEASEWQVNDKDYAHG